MKNNALTAAIDVSTEYAQILEYLSQDDGYWMKNDIWMPGDVVFAANRSSLDTIGARVKIDFREYKNERIRNEVKYYLLYGIKTGKMKLRNILNLYTTPIKMLGKYLSEENRHRSFEWIQVTDIEYIAYLEKNCNRSSKCARNWVHYIAFKNNLCRYFADHYDTRPEMEKDIWDVERIPGVKRSAVEKGMGHRRVNFEDIPPYYRTLVKRYIAKLLTRRSFSYCIEMLMYIKYFFRAYYSHGYGDGFLARLNRADVEEYLIWVMDDHSESNATYRSKAVSFIRQFLDYIQLSESPYAPVKEVERLIFEDDIPKRERAVDTIEKVKYIPEPVREALDASVTELEPEGMIPVYVLLRETGWRGTDVLNLRYDSCLDYLWNVKEGRYVAYLCGEITKTGIPKLRIPIRDEVEKMVRKLSEDAVKISTKENNPEKYLFNTYEGRTMGTPISKPGFVASVRELIERKEIRDGTGELYHFKTHALRHTRAVEYAEQEMPIGIIQQILGHCSLQMTMHYAKVSENKLYEKWKETERLGLFRMDGIKPPLSTVDNKKEGIRYEYVRKSLDAVRVPFGICFKPSKIACRQQMEKCLECSNFCSTQDNIPEYEAELARVEALIALSTRIGRTDWEEKNKTYQEILKKMLVRIQTKGVIHKNGELREDM